MVSGSIDVCGSLKLPEAILFLGSIEAGNGLETPAAILKEHLMGVEALIIVYSHDEAKMQDVPERVDFLSELIALSTYANTKNIIISAMEVTGPVDVEAYTQATRLASKSFPKLISCLRMRES